MPKPATKQTSTEKKKKHASTSSVSKFFTVLGNIFSIGLTTAATTTVALAADAAATASDYTVKPFNTLVRSTTQKYFAPQIAYSSYSIRWNMTGRKRAATEEVIFARSPEIAAAATSGVARRNSLAKPAGTTALRTSVGPPRSSSVPVLTALDIPDVPARRRKPTLLPIITNIPSISIPRSDSSPSPSSPIPFAAFHCASPSNLGTPLLSASYSGSESSYSQPGTPRLSSSAMQSSPLRHVALHDSDELTNGHLYSKSIPIARFSFWNLVGLGESESSSDQKDAEGSRKKDDVGEQERLGTTYEREEDGSDEEPETYKRLCYI